MQAHVRGFWDTLGHQPPHLASRSCRLVVIWAQSAPKWCPRVVWGCPWETLGARCSPQSDLGRPKGRQKDAKGGIWESFWDPKAVKIVNLSKSSGHFKNTENGQKQWYVCHFLGSWTIFGHPKSTFRVIFGIRNHLHSLLNCWDWFLLHKYTRRKSNWGQPPFWGMQSDPPRDPPGPQRDPPQNPAGHQSPW